MKALLLLPVLLLLAAPAHAALHLPARPAEGQHVADLALLISSDDAQEIQAIGERLWAEEQKQLVVATIDSMAQYGGARMAIENFADRLFDAWGLGDQGILLLVSRLDRKARIELGDGWGYDKDAECWSLMEDHLVPAFKRERHSSGLAFGAAALDRMVRGQALPRPPIPREELLGLAGGGLLLLWTIVSLMRSGSSGWAWGFWSVIFGILWEIIKLAFAILSFFASNNTSRYRRRRYGSSWGSSSSSSSSWGGGSSRGSTSSGGGGGATGSW